ncbi:hypothetical protein L226DRAFT_610365 [Lentinus tigrinus ALCF2SS1-7]|uniref:uncharacterized protein n=1 Tax=Lentinus tigrinus ALCF2SS1-7 TaxID=1328758 RepID=UPI0011663FA1|nr:hypothetical protein L226DRAFT_610365 [Lentinus tigrinus ALCF2SS1-7]
MQPALLPSAIGKWLTLFSTILLTDLSLFKLGATMDPYDPSRFLSSVQPPSDSSKRRVHFKSTVPPSDPEPQEEKRVSKRSSKKSAPAEEKRRSYTLVIIVCSLSAMALGMWAGPALFAPGGHLARALASASTIQVPTSPHGLFRQPRRAASIPVHIASYVQKSLRAAVKDPVGRRDFALAADGAKIAYKLTSSFQSDFPSSSIRSPELILDEDMRTGSHWLIPDAQCQVGIKLPAFIYPTHVSIDHIPRELAADIRQAPRHMVLWGLLEGLGNEQRHLAFLERFQMSPLNSTGSAPPITNNGTFLPLAAFEYAIDNEKNVQTFAIDSTVLASRIFFGAVVLEIRTNWGAPSTRLYRVRIHGEEMSE